MSELAIKVENISKRYNLLHKQKNESDSLIGDLARSAKNVFRKNKIGQTNEDFWALKDINFEINKGDRVGIIGKNGAGKSTLLKILSRIVKPSSGRIEYSGRLAGLLEVGTGFHGDLSGRENIYLNGSILGMTKAEIDSKFDEIVAFSEVEQFLDTPVKRYSSGMYVRLAFAVAAHLDNDILIVDEVLAVGDAAFQDKCIGKISADQSNGKTVLFVSHNIGQIAALCNRGIYLEHGNVVYDGSVHTAIDYYLNKNKLTDASLVTFPDDNSDYAITELSLENSEKRAIRTFKHDETYAVKVKLTCRKKLADVVIGISITDNRGKRITSMVLPISDKIELGASKEFTALMPAHLFMPNEFFISIATHIPNVQLFSEHTNALSFKIIDNGSEFYKYSGDLGYVFTKNEWIY